MACLGTLGGRPQGWAGGSGQPPKATTEWERELADTFLGKMAEADPGSVGRAVDKSQS